MFTVAPIIVLVQLLCFMQIRIYELDQFGNVVQIFHHGFFPVLKPNPARGINMNDLKAFLNVIYHYTMNGRDSVLNP